MFKELAEQFEPSKRLAFKVRSNNVRKEKHAPNLPLVDYGKLSPMVRP